MDYKEEYNKALERAKKGMPIDEVFPELKESDDEKIRRGMLEAFKHSDLEVWSDAELRIKDIITWLEKQKEQKPVPKFSVGNYVIDTNYKGEPLYKIVGIDKECYICEYRGDKEMGDRAVMHFAFDNPYLRLEQKPTPDWMPKFLDELRSKKNCFDWDEHRDIEGHILAIINWIAPNYFGRKEKEQNHTSKPKIYDSMDDLIADALIEEIEASELSKSEKHNRIYWINKHRQKPAEKSSMLKKLREHLANTPREQLDAEFEALKDLTIDKPAEWSEEDEQFLLVCKNALQKYQSSDKWDAAIIYNWLEKRLKSLHPHWKPSEVEMDALKDVIDRELLTCRQQVPLESLYKELKKL